MRKTLIIVLLIFRFGAAAYGMDLSIGGGISYTPITSKLIIDDWGYEGSTSDHYNFGTINLYLDTAYVQAVLTYGTSLSGSYDSEGSFSGSGEYTNKETYLGVGVVLKYPFVFDKFSLFPLLGVESDLNLSYRDAAGNDLKSSLTIDEIDHLNMYFLKLGVGADINVGKRMYVRPVVILSYKLRSRLEKDIVDYYKDTYGLEDVKMHTTKWDLAVLVGYRL